MKRFIETQLVAWKAAKRRKPLLVRGARQVGKTYSIDKFGAAQFAESVVVDLERNRAWHHIFSKDLDTSRILSELRIVLDKQIVPGKSLLFLDEIQSCPRALMALRYFYEECPDLHVIAAGSLLDFALSEASFPVGRLQFLEMHPLTFAEFLWATGKRQAAKVVLSRQEQVAPSVHEMLLEELRKYFFIGGMPESVKAYAASGDLRECFTIQRELCLSFEQDFAKYVPRADPYCLDAVFNSVARHLGQQIKYTRLAQGFSNSTIKKAFELLCKARVVKKISSTSPAGLPLGASASPKKFKALMLDIGLLQHLRGMPADIEYSKTDLLSIHEGALAEQFVGQELLVAQDSELYYWARQAKSSTAEVDYLIVRDGEIIPVEVKAGSSGRLKSMHLLLKSFHNCPHGLVFSTALHAELPDQRLIFKPLYHAFSAAQPPRQISLDEPI